MELKKTIEFEKWFSTLQLKERSQVEARLVRILEKNYFGDTKSLGNDLAELRWKNGRRIYFSYYVSKNKVVILLLGGYKNAQKKDIQKARKILEKFKEKI